MSEHLPEKTRNWSVLTPYLLVAPTVILVFLFTVYPSFQTIYQSLFQPGLSRSDPPIFVGLQNYVDLFDSTHFLGSRLMLIFRNTLVFAGATVAISLPIALVMALLVNRRVRGLALWRFSFFYPTVLPLIGAASIWAFLYADTVGLINTVLRSLGLPSVNWTGDPNVVLLSVTVVNIWKQTGFYMIFYLAGLQSIPRDIYEAAALDGAGYFQQLFRLTLPLLRRTTLFLLIVSFTYAFQTVEHLQVLNQGNPADRGNLLLYFVFQLIGSRRNLGYVNAITVILVGLLLIFTISNFLIFERGGDDDQ
ncbi:MAG: sugar ABC transporter permease [Anaerolineae bacterium]|nr:sugar ABC transporter permease [Anaerolineae bacterium]MCB9460381.1 sugar ABC transporter permease [Anaerolineaceae bacterium]